jgi:tRNA 2-selenouridine synthase
MKQIISIDFYFKNLKQLPIIDVRSPGEFAKGNIPNAHNIELFTDDERAVVGTAYKRESQEKAIAIGYEFVLPKLQNFVDSAISVAPNKEAVIHCWRGGMRSDAFANHLIKNGFKKVYVIENGYKAFRNYVLDSFTESLHLKVLGGYTGTGKTEILHALKRKGAQVIDLEGLANHRGSAFGGIDLPEQPTTEQFENKLFFEIQTLNSKLPIWVEDESKSIGKVSIPNAFYLRMGTMPVYFLEVPFEERVKHLVATYASLNQQKLADAIDKIAKRLGNDKAKLALDALKDKDYDKVVTLTLFYYDKYYLKGLQKRAESTILKFEIPSVKPEETAEFLKQQ